MTVLVTHPRRRTTAPRGFAVPVVRELPSAPASAGTSPAW
jgi:hypothetical protein